MISLINDKIPHNTLNDFYGIVYSKSIKTNDNLDWRSTISMTDNEYDFYSFEKNGRLTLTRIRRLGVMALLPKVIIIFSENKSNGSYEIRLGFFTFIVSVLAIVIYILNIYYHFAFGDNTLKELLSTGGLILLYFGLIYIEMKVTNLKLKRYIRKINSA